jgi:hypothetical protein
MGIITRYPMGEEELVRTLERWVPGEVRMVLETLQASGEGTIGAAIQHPVLERGPIALSG